MRERTWKGAYGKKSNGSDIPPHPSVTVPHDPNDDTASDAEAIRYWIQFSDFYLWPYIQTYDSWEDLMGESTGKA